MNFKRAARKTLSGLLSAMMVITQMSNNFTVFAEEIPVDEPAGEVASTPVETTEVPTPEPEALPAEEVVPEQPAEVTPEPEADSEANPVENPEPSETVTEEEKEPEDPEKEEQEEKEEKEPNTRTVYEGYGEGVNVSVTLTDPEAIADDAVLNVEFIPTEDPTELIYDIYFTEDKEEEGVVRTDLKSGSANVVMTFSASQLTDIIQATDNADLVLFDGNGAVLPSVPSIADQKISYTVTSVGKVRIFNQNYPKEETEEEKSDEEEKEEEEADSRTVYTGAGDGILVTAVLDDAAAIPDDAELSVYKVSESDTAIAYDISFVGPEKDEEGNPTGNTITYEPTNGSVSVTMQFLEGQLTQNLGVQSADQVEVVHLPGSAMPEAVGANVSVEAETVSFALTSFSVVIIGKSWVNPELFKTEAKISNEVYTYGESIQYLLTHYGVVTSGNVKYDSHTMAAVLIGGNLTGTGAGGAGFGDDAAVAKVTSSYIAGSVKDFGGQSASRCGNTDLAPLYLGTVNHVEGTAQTWETYFVWGKPRYNNVDSNNSGNPIYITDDYVDFTEMYKVIQRESEQLLEQGKSGRPTRNGSTLTIVSGQYVTINEADLVGISKIDITGDMTAAVNTLINLPQDTNIDFSHIEFTINGTQPQVQESGPGTSIVWNMPFTNNVSLPSQNWIGHIVAPNAKITKESGNYNGGFICRELETSAEGHTYQYNGGKLISDETGFSASKTFGKGIWPEGVSFTVRMEQSVGGGPLPENPVITLTKTNPTADFGNITFNPKEPREQIIPDYEHSWNESYIYNVYEEVGNVDGITYDQRLQKLQLVVHYTYKLPTGGQPIAKAEIIEKSVSLDGGRTWAKLTTHSAYTFSFQNDSEITAKAKLQATKVVKENGQGREWGDADSFDFVLTPVLEGSPMPAQGGDKATATKANKTATFGEIEFDTVGTYSYYIQEVEPENKIPGVTYDTTKYIANVVVKDDGTGKMVAEVSYSTGKDLVITNKYEEVKAPLQATKEFDYWGTDGSYEFTFNLAGVKDADGNMPPMPATTQGIATSTNRTVNFGDITFYEEGTYNYTITEENGKKPGVTYDTRSHNAQVVVDRDSDGKLRATVTYDGKGDPLTITNTYESVKTHFEAEKDFDYWDETLIQAFEFSLSPVPTDGVTPPMPAGKDSAMATKDDKAVWGDITYTKPGTYYYTIKEVNSHVDGVIYDDKEHSVKVVVSQADDATNKLTAEVTYDDQPSLTITNKFTNVKKKITATKNFNDWGKAESFTFQLRTTNNAPMPSGTKGGVKEGQATQTAQVVDFGEITYTKAGRYLYTITEVNDGVDGVTYDTDPHQVVVNVTKDETTNALSAEVTYDGNPSLTITNTFTAAQIPLKVTKQINDWGNAKKFTFHIEPQGNAPKPERLSGNATPNNLIVNFGNVTFDKAGTYRYIIYEDNDGEEGVTYDDTRYSAVVTVDKDEKTNKLSASVKYDGDKDTLTIVNSSQSSNANIQVTKSYNNWGDADSFTFELTAGDNDANVETPMPAGVTGTSMTATATKADPIAKFGSIKFEHSGLYNYTVQEVVDPDKKIPGVTYDTKPRNVQVNVSKMPGSNILVAEVIYEGQESLTITNTFNSTTAHLEAAKEFNNWGEETSFTFDLAGVKDAEGNEPPMPVNTTAVATTKNKTAIFEDIEFDKEGTYVYTITERNGGLDGVTYDTNPHKATVTVKADAVTNKLVATVTYEDGKTAIIKNTFESTHATLEAEKEFNNWGKETEFKFNLAPITGDDGSTPPMPKNPTATATTATKKATFESIEYKTAGIYKYTITEQKGNMDGVYYNTTPHTAIVTVTKDPTTNKLSADVKYDNELPPLIVTNTFTAVEETLHVTKAFENWGKADAFEFVIVPGENTAGVETPKPPKDSATATEDNKMVTFGPLKFEKAGVYEYTIRERNGYAPGVTYDTTDHKAIVTVTKDPDTNALSTDVKYDETKSALIIKNDYEAGKAQLEVTKDFEDWGKANTFRFTLEAGENDAEVATPMPKDNIAIASKNDNPAKFEEITYEKPGTYHYTITEINDGADGVTYDTEPHNVVVTVKQAEDATNKLTAEVTYDGNKSLKIKNTYKSTSLELKAEKKFKNWGKANSFTFVLEPLSKDAPMPKDAEDGKKSVTVTDSKNPIAKFGEITYETAGMHYYSITEVNDGVDGVTYDTKSHYVEVFVNKDPATNELSCYAIYDGAADLIIENTFEAATADIEATKTMPYWGGADSFTFELTAGKNDADVDTPMPEGSDKGKKTAVATKASPKAAFGTISYDKAGTYNYTVTEVNDKKPGVKYDATTHDVVVTVTKDKDTNKLSASVSYGEAETLEIKNTYDAKGEYVFEGIKTLKGRKIKDDEFTFTLVGDKDVSQEVTNKGESFKFEPVTFELSDLNKDAEGNYIPTEFKYTIKETKGSDKSITYDETTYEITLTVSDNGDGTLDVKSDGTIDEIKFINEYQQQKGEGEFIAKKVLRGNQKLKDQQFTFELKDKDGKVLQSKKNDANGNVQFDKIDYEEKGEFVYTVSEVNDGQKDVIYDNSVYTITVKVEDGEDGKLKVTSVITKGGQVVEGIVFYNSTTPNTGVHNGTAFLTGAAAASLSGIAILEYLRRRQKNSKK